MRDVPRARKAFRDFQGAHLSVDYPEAVYEAWISFEEKWGDAKDIETAVGRVSKLTAALNEKRAKVRALLLPLSHEFSSLPFVLALEGCQQSRSRAGYGRPSRIVCCCA
jgi:hypothetical protein